MASDGTKGLWQVMVPRDCGKGWYQGIVASDGTKGLWQEMVPRDCGKRWYQGIVARDGIKGWYLVNVFSLGAMSCWGMPYCCCPF